MNEDKSKLKCFIITPIGGDDSPVRRSAEGVIDAVIYPVLQGIGFEDNNISVAHRMPNPGSINKQLINRIIQDDLVIVNLTGLNPNVMYELAIRHAARKPVVQICEQGTRLPFDIIDERTIFYTNDMAGVIELKEKFEKMVLESLKDENPDNPIYRVVESNLIQQSTINEPEKYLMHRIDRLEQIIVNSLNSRQAQNRYFHSEKTVQIFRIGLKINTSIKSVINQIMSIPIKAADITNIHLEERSKESDSTTFLHVNVHSLEYISTIDLKDILIERSAGQYEVTVIEKVQG